MLHYFWISVKILLLTLIYMNQFVRLVKACVYYFFWYFTKTKPLKNHGKWFLFPLKCSFCHENFQVFVILFFLVQYFNVFRGRLIIAWRNGCINYYCNFMINSKISLNQVLTFARWWVTKLRKLLSIFGNLKRDQVHEKFS